LASADPLFLAMGAVQITPICHSQTRDRVHGSRIVSPCWRFAIAFDGEGFRIRKIHGKRENRKAGVFRREIAGVEGNYLESFVITFVGVRQHLAWSRGCRWLQDVRLPIAIFQAHL